MKSHRKVFYGALFAALLITVPSLASARPGWHGGQGGPGYMAGPGVGPAYNGGPGWMQSIAPEKQKAFSEMAEAHAAKIQPLRQQIWKKQTLLNALSQNAKADPKELAALVDDMATLRDQIDKERQAFASRVEKEIGISMPARRGYGYGGYGHSFRGGHMRGGSHHMGGF